jgi:DNA-binding response OmpR family regulator
MNALNLERGHGHILVVDDDVDIRESITDVLLEDGYQVATAPSGPEALRWLERADALPCLVLLDFMMPHMDGAQFMAEKRKNPRLEPIPVLIVSAMHNVAERSAMAKAQGYIKKPIRIEELLERAGAYCRHRESASP